MQQRRGKFVLDRQLLHIYFANKKKFTKFEALIYLISEAAYEDHPTDYNGNLIQIKRGEFPKTILGLVEIFGWSDGKVQRFLNKLKDIGFITTSSDKGFNIITICNYDEMQKFEKTKATQTTIPKTVVKTTDPTTNRTKKQNNKNNSLPNFQMLEWHLKLERLMGDIHFKQWAIPSTFMNGTVYFDDQLKLDWCKNHYHKQFETALDMVGEKLKGFAIRKAVYNTFNQAGGVSK
jgi:hypothetical protein